VSHALIIDDNMVLSRAIANRLVPFGFDSIDRAWAEQQALDAAKRHTPDLIVAGESIADGSPVDVARLLAADCDVPVLRVAINGQFELERCSPCRRQVEGPHSVAQLDAAIRSLCARRPGLLRCA
jgi:DNA-binding NarL/FixJ family response regulator